MKILSQKFEKFENSLRKFEKILGGFAPSASEFLIWTNVFLMENFLFRKLSIYRPRPTRGRLRLYQGSGPPPSAPRWLRALLMNYDRERSWLAAILTTASCSICLVPKSLLQSYLNRRLDATWSSTPIRRAFKLEFGTRYTKTSCIVYRVYRYIHDPKT